MLNRDVNRLLIIQLSNFFIVLVFMSPKSILITENCTRRFGMVPLNSTE